MSVNTDSTRAQIVSAINGALDAAVKDWFRRQCADPYVSMYLYYKPMGMAFWIGEEPLNDTWELATPERVSPAKTRDQVYNTYRNLCNSLPIIPIA